MNPEAYVIHNNEWEAFAERRTDAAYEDLDNFLDRHNVRIDVVAGMFYSPRDKRVYMHAAMANDLGSFQVTAERLAEHELGHPKGWKHPTGAVRGFLHAVKVGFDTRAFTRLLRWRPCKAIHAEAQAWCKNFRLLRRHGLLEAQHAPVDPPRRTARLI